MPCVKRMLMARLGAPFVDQTWPLNSFDKPLLARVFKPRGEGPFPALVECHGGAWCLSDRTTERLRHQPWRRTASLFSRSKAIMRMCPKTHFPDQPRNGAAVPVSSRTRDKHGFKPW